LTNLDPLEETLKGLAVFDYVKPLITPLKTKPDPTEAAFGVTQPDTTIARGRNLQRLEDLKYRNSRPLVALGGRKALARVEWLPIPDYPDYMVSSCGGYIKSVARASYTDPNSWREGARRIKDSLMTPTELKTGYWRLTFTVNGKLKTAYLHSILASVFLGPCPEGHRLEVKKVQGVQTTRHMVKYVPLKHPHKPKQLRLKLDSNKGPQP
jgi:hypothetical protein